MSDAGSYRSDGEDTIQRTPVSTRNVVSGNFFVSMIPELFLVFPLDYN